ncbi:putative nwd2 protein [Mycena sanguinolenta]|uniref:Putative nwd2 protein n=1 Tax=Mycena sanguinolenta TaxID=230812 RepID=A0A8H7CF19_9AGAR|nr:putative nwd2 protein [Mycena sanguinolenta]
MDPEFDTDSESDLQSDSESDVMDSESNMQSDCDGPADPDTNILWLYGPAGAGKSAIMQTLASQLRDAGRLGGAFFFKCGHATRGNAKTLFATIAYQLALAVPWLRTSISRIVENDPSIVVRSIAIQIQTLISDPCRSHANENCDPIIILIDGLDECEGHEVQEEILYAIHHSSKHPIPLRFIVASRPEAHIREVFESPVYSGNYCSFNVEQSFDDVCKYLRDEFSRIHREHRTMTNISLPWPPPDVLEQLVENSSGHFIYASTIIKFIDDKNYRPTERLAVVQDPNNSASESAFDTLDQLYMTILSSAPRQSQLIPILRNSVNTEEPPFCARCDVPSEDKDNDEIFSHHASFVDFLNNPDRSGSLCVGILNNRISLARYLLQFVAGPLQRTNIYTLSNLIHFIVSLPPSGGVAELFPLIGSVNTDYIFDPFPYTFYREKYDDLASVISWLKKNPSAPADVIQLWEDYAFMLSINMPWFAESTASVKHNVSPSPELLRTLVSMGLLRYQLWELPTKLDLTWTDLMCSLRPQFNADARVLPVHQPQTALPWVTRDLALQLIRKMVKNHVDTNGGVNLSACREAVMLSNAEVFLHGIESAYSISQYWLGRDISYLVRLSPPCPVLYRELQSIPPSGIWLSEPSGYTLIHHVSKWLESFPNSTMELITFWQQAMPEHGCYHTSTPNADYEESHWRDCVGYYNDTIVKLHLPDSFKFIL